VLAGVCEHPHSESAVRLAVEWADALSGEVVAVHVRRYLPWMLCPYETACLARDWQDTCEKLALSHALRALTGSPVPWQVVSRPGGVAQGIAAEARARHAVAVVVGAPDGRLDRMPRGSVARALRRSCPMPVLAVRPDGSGAINAAGVTAHGRRWNPLPRLGGSLAARFGAAPTGPLADLDPSLVAAMSRRERRETERAMLSVRSAALR
jgi:nucleotide-binding universal stress UspA family protein